MDNTSFFVDEKVVKKTTNLHFSVQIIASKKKPHEKSCGFYGIVLVGAT
jgi:hypothetical protein